MAVHRIPSLAHGFKSTAAAKPRSLKWSRPKRTHQHGESGLLFGEHFVGILDERAYYRIGDESPSAFQAINKKNYDF